MLSLPAMLQRLVGDSHGANFAPPAPLRALDCLEYEDRTLFSATPVGGDLLIAAAAAPPPADAPAPIGEATQVDPSTAAATTTIAPSTTADESSTTQTTSPDASSTQQTGDQTVRKELVLVDSSVANYQQLVDDLANQDDPSRQFIVEVFDGGADGVEQVTAILAKYQDLSAVHFVTHAADGTLNLGSTRLTDANVGQYADALTAWRQSLSADADLLFYGCELAASDAGQNLLAAIEQYTGADVAASTNNTGYALFGGDWNLEFADGPIETSVAFSTVAQRDWMNLLGVSVDSVSTGLMNNATPLTISHTTSGTDRLMLVAIAIDPHGETITSVTYNGVALTLEGSVEQPGQHSRVELWSLVAPDLGTHDVVITVTGTANNGMNAGVITFTNVDQSTPLSNLATNFGNSTTASVTVTSQVGDTVFAFMHNHQGTSATPGAGQTEYWDLVDEASNGSGTLAAGAASVNNTWTVGNDDWTALGVSIHTSNDAPVLDNTATPVLNSVTEDAGAPSGAVGTLVSSLVDFAVPAGQVDNVTDPDAGALLGIAVTNDDTTNGSWWYSTNGGTNWNALGAVADNNARLLAADANTRVYFQPTANYNGTVTNGITFRAWDQTTGTNGSLADTSTSGGTTAFSANTDTASITVTAVNDGPTNTVPAAAQSTNEDTALVFSSGNSNQISIADVDAGSSSVQVTLTATNGTITLSGVSGLSFTNGDGTSDATMTFTGTITNINTALNGLSFTPTSEYNGPASLEIVTDDLGNTGTGGALTDTDTVNITVNAVNDAPVNTVPVAQSTNEDTTLVFSSGNSNQISIADLDAGSSVVRVTLTATNGAITLSGVTGLSFSTGDGTADATMTFTGTIADINTALNGLSFAPTSNFNGAASLQIVTNDQGNTGAGGAQSDTDVVAITVNAVNDAPTNTVPPAQSTNEDTPLVFSSGNGNQISIADVDAGSSSVEVTLTATDGAITLNGVTGLSFTTGDGTADATMTFTGTIADINTALNGLSFTPSADFNGAASLQITTNDQGNTGSGGALSNTDSIAITVNAVNDAPTLAQPSAQTTPFNTALSFSSAGGNAIVVADVDAGSASLELSLSVSNGTLTLAQTAGLTFITGTGTNDATIVVQGTAANLNAALDGLIYRPVSTYRGADALSVVVDDLGNSGSGGALTASGAVNLTVSPAAQRLYLTAPSNQAADNFEAVFSSAGGNPIAFTDAYAENPTLTVTITASSGTFTLGSTAGLTFTAGGSSGSAMSFTGALADVNAALQGATFQATTADGSLTIVGSDPSRDGTGSQTVSAVTAVSQPTIYPSPSAGPTVDSETTDTTDNETVQEVIVSRAAPPAVPTAIDRVSVAAEDRSSQAAVIAAPFTDSLVATAGPVANIVTTSAVSPDELEAITQRVASTFAGPRSVQVDRGVLLDVEIPWSQVVFSDADRPEQSLSDSLIVGTAGITASLSVGYALWSVRAASLLSSLLSSMPAWQSFDPLPVIEFERHAKDDEDDELSKQLFDKTEPA